MSRIEAEAAQARVVPKDGGEESSLALLPARSTASAILAGGCEKLYRVKRSFIDALPDRRLY